jgi:hypothetical protein
MILLDTNVVIVFFNGNQIESLKVESWLDG